MNNDDEDDNGDDNDSSNDNNDNYSSNYDNNNNGSNKELYLDENESEDKCKDKEKEKDKLMLDDTPPKAPVSHYFLILALLSDLCKHFVHAYRDTWGPWGQQVAKDIAASQISIGRKHKHLLATAPRSRKCHTHPFQIEGALHLSLHLLSEGSNENDCIFPEDFVGAVHFFFFSVTSVGLIKNLSVKDACKWKRKPGR